MVYNRFRIVVIKMKKVLKIAIILLIILTMQMTVCHAAIVDADATTKYKPNAVGEETELVGKANIIATVIRNVGIVVSVISLMAIGIRMMVGSVEERTQMKEALPGYLLGVLMIVGMSLIPTLVYNIVNNKPV